MFKMKILPKNIQIADAANWDSTEFFQDNKNNIDKNTFGKTKSRETNLQKSRGKGNTED